MDVSRLQYFVAVANAGSFSRAAAALNMTQPSLSRQVQLLEEELGLRLMERHGRGIHLTESGEALMAHARAIFERTEHARIDMAERQRNPRGRLTVGLPHRVAQVVTAELVERFRANFAEAGITVIDGQSVRLRELLIGGRIELGILFDPPPSPSVHVELIVRETMVLVSRRALPPVIALDDLVSRRLVLPSSPNAIRRLLDEKAELRGTVLMPVAEVDSVHTLLNIVARGVADSVVPAGALRQWGMQDQLHVAEINAPAIRNKVVLAMPTARPATRLTAFAAGLLRELVKRHFGGQAR